MGMDIKDGTSHNSNHLNGVNGEHCPLMRNPSQEKSHNNHQAQDSPIYYVATKQGDDGNNTNNNNVPFLRPSGKSQDSLMYSVASTNDMIHHNRNNSLMTMFGGGGSGAGSASDHLANERTYLGWIFFSVIMIGIGAFLIKGGDPDFQIEAILATLIGFVSLVSSTDRYFRVMRMLQHGSPFEPNVNNMLFVVVVVFASAGISFGFSLF